MIRQLPAIGVTALLAVLPALSISAAPPPAKKATPSPTPAAALVARLRKTERANPGTRLTLLAVRRQGALPAKARGAAAWEAARALPTTWQRREYLLYHGTDWRRDLTTTDAQGDPQSHVLVGCRKGVARILQETGHAEQARRTATVGGAPELDAADLFLLGRSAELLDGVTWTAVQKSGALQVLTGKRGAEKITAALRTTPRVALERFQSQETTFTPQGSVFQSRELTVSYQNGKSGLEPKTIESLVYASDPIDQVALTRYSVEGAQLSVPVRPDELALAFPQGTKVSDQRFQPVLHYVQGDHELSLAELKALSQQREAAAGPQLGKAAPGWELKGLDGKTWKLADLRGKVVVLTWFASWCGPCRAEAPQMEAEIWRKYRERGLTVVGINAGEQGDPEPKARAFAQEAGVTYPVVLDADNDASEAYGIQAFPTLAVIDRKGVLRYFQIGFQEEDVKKNVEAALAQK